MTGCGSPFSTKAQPLGLDEGAKIRVTIGNEWRDAWTMERGGTYEVAFPRSGEQGFLQFGILDSGGWLNRVHLTVVENGQTVQEFSSAGEGAWSDFCLPVGSEEHKAIVRSRGGFSLSHARFVPSNAGKTNVLIIMVDTLRLDHVGVYGYDRPTTPAIDALAADGVVFSQLTPQSSWTRPSVASLLTSTYPSVHGAEDRPDMLRADMPSLGEALAKAGYDTHAFMTNPNCLPVWGFGGEFARFLDVQSKQYETTHDDKVVDAFLETLDCGFGTPWFAYVHMMGPHDPYAPPEPFAERFASDDNEPSSERLRNIDLYDGEIAFSDAQIGRLLARLKHRDAYDDTLIILLSDHGEEFGEHGGAGHGKTLYEEMLRVPLIIKFPNGDFAGRRYDGLIENVDIAPAVLDYLELSPEERFQGKSFMDSLRTGAAARAMVFASLRMEKNSLRATKSANLKYVKDLVADQHLWFNLLQDPLEHEPLPDTPSGGEGLMDYALHMGMRNTAGLHLLITADFQKPVHVQGSILGAKLVEPVLRFPGEEGSVHGDEEGLKFSFTMEERYDSIYGVAGWFEQVGAQARAHLTASTETTDGIIFNLTVDGKAVASENIFIGQLKRHGALENTVYSIEELIAHPDAFEPAALPRRFAVYVWFVPQTEQLEREDLSPDMVEALEALGYL